MSVAALAARLRAGELSPREAVEGYLERIEAHRDLNAYISVRAGGGTRGGGRGRVCAGARPALGRAGRRQGRDRRRRRCRRRPRRRSSATTSPDRDAECVERLRAAGAIVLGKLNTARVRVRRADDEPALRPGPQPVGPRPRCAAARAAAAARPPPPTSPPARSAPTPPARSGSRPPSAASRASGRRSGSSPNEGVVPVAWTFDTVGPIARSAEDCRAAAGGRCAGTPRSSRRAPSRADRRRHGAVRAGRPARSAAVVRGGRAARCPAPRAGRAAAARGDADDPAARDASRRRRPSTSAGSGRGSPTTGRTSARACSPACSCPRPPTSPASAPGAG